MAGRLLGAVGVVAILGAPSVAAAACAWGFPVGDAPDSPAPLTNNHPVGGMNLPDFGSHLGADFWSGGGCTDLGQTVYAVADGEVVEIVDGLGSYLDVVVIRHDDATLGPIYSMYGHIARDAGLSEGSIVMLRDPIGSIDDVLAYFSPCHLHFELLSETAFEQGPFCNGCEGAGYDVSPGYDQQAGVTQGVEPSGETYLDVNDGIEGNRWYHVDGFIEARLDAECGRCPDGNCNAGESYDTCPEDCPPCALIPPEGATLDESGACFTEGGDPQYWNYERAAGIDGTLQWTHTTDSEAIDNFGIWALVFDEAGTYRTEVHVPGGTADTQQATYTIAHDGSSETIVSDQSAADGWIELGELQFAAGAGQSIRLDDNTGEPFSTMTRIVFDAVRVTRLDLPPGGSGGDGVDDGDGGLTGDGGGDDGGDGGAPSTGDGDDDDDGDGNGDAADTNGGADGTAGAPLPGGGGRGDGGGCSCRTTPSSQGAPLTLLLLMATTGRRRRRRPA